MITRVFVYGTLKAGEKLDRKTFADKRVSVKPALIEGTLYDAGWFPAVKLGGKNTVHGEVHQFNKKDIDSIVGIMDSIEGYNPSRKNEHNLYVRRIVVVKSKDGEKLKAYVYEFSGKLSEDRRVKSGVWTSKD